MREHKYRGKSKEKGNLVYGWGCFTDEREKKYIISSENNWIEVEDIQDSTNLHDKNGNEIYEGDVIQNDSAFKDTWTVRWNDKCARFEMGCNYKIDMPHISIIGNVFENRELLTNQ
jgi:hypothetical protein